jgi:hypothetical protein
MPIYLGCNANKVIRPEMEARINWTMVSGYT